MKEEIKREIGKYFELNKMKTAYQNLWDTAKEYLEIYSAEHVYWK